MKPLPLLPLTLTAVLLCGCPDSKAPKVPPRAPEPKVVANTPHQLPDATLMRPQSGARLAQTPRQAVLPKLNDGH